MTEEASKNRLLAHNHLRRPQNKRDEELVEQRSRICILLWINLKNKPDLVEKKETKMGTLYCDFLKQSWQIEAETERREGSRELGDWESQEYHFSHIS